MKILAACTLALLAACSAHAQDADAERNRERERIRSERTAADARYAEAKRACNARFAVNDCVDRATRAHNTTVGELRRQELLINDAERRQRADERLRELEERNSPQARKEAEERRARAAADQKEREAEAAGKARKRAQQQEERAAHPLAAKSPSGPSGPQGSARAPGQSKGSPLSAEEAASNRAAYEARLREAEEHKAEVRERIATRAKPAASALPIPK